MKDQLSVRLLQEKDIERLTNYWLDADPDFLTGMGVDPGKMPDRKGWNDFLTEQLGLPIEKKQSYYVIWEVNGEPVGHSSVNKIIFGKEAYMHLHLWKSPVRKSGYGSQFVKMTLPRFFLDLQLKDLYCEPYTQNSAPNKTLEKIGFEFVKTYSTIPGMISREHPVNLWRLSSDQWKQLYPQCKN